MTEASVRKLPRTSVFQRLYMLVWVGLAGVSVAYVGLAATQPGFVETITGRAAVAKAKSEQAEKAKVVAQLKSLRVTVDGLRNKLSRIESRVQEQNVPPVQPVFLPTPPLVVAPVKAEPAPPPVVPQAVEAKPVAVKSANVIASGKTPPLPVRVPLQKKVTTLFQPKQNSVGAVVLNQAQSGRVVTGSIPKIGQPANAAARRAERQVQRTAAAALNAATPKPPAISFGAPTITTAAAPGNQSAVVVSVASSLAGLRASWQQLSGKHPQLLGKLDPRYDVMSAGGPYRLLAGPLSDRVEADRLCSALRVHQVNCGVGEFVGNAL